ncbi:transcriptional regulator [Tabrizicola sp. TH137]|uniref:helix-turn-helix domain-containing protein n=1 Tax=Tabrizicola sp. TH137 TaxID=2067452 RepID=UPI000C7AE9CF|nr:helix-turn-helix domain-containing protein [Tabrizicola sp. TH137]PLL11433.1 transcriptional regulator [Tabrizicola sp. TH137]
MSQTFESIMRGLTEVEAYLKGNTSGAITHHIEVPTPDVRAIRASTGLSQADFARSIGVSKGTLVNWEQARRRPEGPARVLLALIAKDPTIVQRMLA